MSGPSLSLHPTRLLLAALFASLFLVTPATAQDRPLVQEFELRVGANVEKKIIKDLDVVVGPGVRTNGFNPDKYMVELGLKYDPIKYLSIRPGFRFLLNETNDGLRSEYRPRLDLVGDYKIGDFKPNARLRYTYEFGPQIDNEHMLRYRLGLDYEIGKTDVTLGASAEAFHSLTFGNFHKMRYTFGGDWKFYGTKKVDQWIKLAYNLDYYLNEYRNKHFVELNYKIRF